MRRFCWKAGECAIGAVFFSVIWVTAAGCGGDPPATPPPAEDAVADGGQTDGGGEETDTATADVPDAGPITPDTAEDVADTGEGDSGVDAGPECTVDADCTSDDKCQVGACSEGKCVFDAMDCSGAAVTCQTASCDPATGTCVVEDKVAPSDDDFCTEDLCVACGADENCIDKFVYNELLDCKKCPDVVCEGANGPVTVACDFIQPEQIDDPDCAYCQLLCSSCNPLDPTACEAPANELASADPDVASTEILKAVVMDLPTCRQTICDPNLNRCALADIPGCCGSVADCPLASEIGGCFFTQCVDEAPDNLSPIMQTADVAYCQSEIQVGCCQGQANQAALSTESFSSFPELPGGWTVLDDNLDDHISWHELQGDEHCATGDCIHLGYFDGDSTCFKYSNQQLDPETCQYSEEAVACTAATAGLCAPGNVCLPSTGSCPGVSCCQPTAIVVALRAPTVQLQPAAVPWALTFKLRMDTEPPANAILRGDPLTVVVVDGTTETVVFDSAEAFKNTTGGGYESVAVDLSQWGGKTIGVEFRFDTTDEEFNAFGEGVFLDDVAVQTICQNELCTADAAEVCKAADACEKAACVLFQPKTALADEPLAGFCVAESAPGCQACKADVECQGPPPQDGKTYGIPGVCGDGVCTYKILDCTSDENLTMVDFESAELPEAWTFQDDGSCGNFWAATTNRAMAGTRSLYFGHESALCGDSLTQQCDGLADGSCPNYKCDQPAGTQAEATTGEHKLPSGGFILLNFELFMSTEWDGVPFDMSYCTDFNFCTDRLQLYAVLNGVETPVWDSYDIGSTTGCDWKNISVDVSAFGGQTAAFRFRYDSFDNNTNEFEGFYIDNFALNSVCQIACTADSDCAVLANACDAATCEEGQCVVAPDESCCTASSECGLAGSCELSECVLGDDGKGFCVYSINDAATSCCDQGHTYWSEGFDGTAAPEGWVIETPDGAPESVKWYWSPGQGVDGTGGLVFNDSQTGTYEATTNAVKGTITSPNLQIPPGQTPTLEFDLFLSTEFDGYSQADFDDYLASIQQFYFDRLSVRGTVGGVPGPELWRSDNGMPLNGSTIQSDGTVTWMKMAFSLAPLSGKSFVQLVFEFDSYVGDANAFPGARIDNIRITQACGNDPCFADAWCQDGDVCTADSCVEGLCENTDELGKDGCCFAAPLSADDFEGTLGAWTEDSGGSDVLWHPSQEKARTGAWSLRWGNPTDATYSSCTCPDSDAAPACETGCPTLSGMCQAESLTGIASSESWTAEAGKDYTISFSLYADFNVSEGDTGFSEGFLVNLVVDTPSGKATLATLVCHHGLCDAPDFDPCASGINFEYPGCLSAGHPGDYQKWNDYSFKLSDLLCGSVGSVPEGILENLAIPGGQADFRMEVQAQLGFQFGNCDSGLYLDNVRFQEECDGWGGVCQ